MKNKSNSIKQLNSNISLPSNNSLLKYEISEELRKNGTTKLSGIVFKSKAEKYRISILNSLYIEGVKDASHFIKEYQKIVDNKKIPLLSVELVILLYKSWRNYPEFIDNFNSLVQKTNQFIDSVDFWTRILLICNKNKVNDSLHFHFLSVIISKINWNEKSIPQVSDLVYSVFWLPSANNQNHTFIFTNEKCKEMYSQLFTWIDWLTKKSLKLTDQEKIVAIKRVVNVAFKGSHKSEFYKSKKIFLPFLNMLQTKFSSHLIYNLPASVIDKAFFCYTCNPSFFSKQSFFIKDFDGKEFSFKNDNLIMSFFKNYHFPTILLDKFGDLNADEKKMLVYVLNGNNLCRYKKLPFNLTKKGSHIFTNLYRGYLEPLQMEEMDRISFTVTNYLIYAQLRANEVSHEVSIEFFKKDISKKPKNLEYWIYTITLLYKQGMNATFFNTIVDYLRYKVIQRNETVNLKGKSILNLVGDVNRWHDELANKRHANLFSNVVFKDVDINEFVYEFLEHKFVIKKISTKNDLYFEGRDLHHCVFSYLYKCKNGSCSIFSLRKFDNKNNELKLLTIEVRQKSIYQIRGYSNRAYNETEFEIIKLWATAENLRIAV